MNNRTIYITDYDLHRLKMLVAGSARSDNKAGGYLRDLEQELDRAAVLPSSEIPSTVVTMNSRFMLRDLDTAELAEYTLVFPGKANITKGKLSILAPVGTALLGCSELDEVEWEVPAGLKRFRVEKVLFQPEAAEAFYL